MVERIRRISRCCFVDEVCHWEWGFEVSQAPDILSFSVSLIVGQDEAHSYFSITMHVNVHIPCCNDNRISLGNSEIACNQILSFKELPWSWCRFTSVQQLLIQYILDCG